MYIQTNYCIFDLCFTCLEFVICLFVNLSLSLSSVEYCKFAKNCAFALLKFVTLAFIFSVLIVRFVSSMFYVHF